MPEVNVSNNDEASKGARAYETGAISEGCVGRDGVQRIDNGFKTSDQ